MSQAFKLPPRGLPCPHCGRDVFLLRAQDPPPEPRRHEVNLKGRYGLSRREAQCAEMAMDGLGNKEIASHMGTSAQTVKNYLCSVYRKMGVERRGQIILVSLGLRKPLGNNL